MTPQVKHEEKQSTFLLRQSGGSCTNGFSPLRPIGIPQIKFAQRALGKLWRPELLAALNCIKVPEKQIKKFMNTHSYSIVAWILFVESSY